MSDEFYSPSRVNRFEKKRKSTKAISILLILGGILVIILIGWFLFGGGEENNSADQSDENSTTENADQNSSGNEQAPNDDSSNGEKESAGGEENQTEDDTSQQDETSENADEGTRDEQSAGEREQVDSSGDSNVVEAYTADWQPVGTSQQEPHQTTYEEGTQDWEEMMEAIELATDLTSDDRVVWWVERAGDQQVIATVSDSAETEIYRTYVTWVENQGWKPTKVEVLEENDQKYRFENE
ncbi:YrrS family protein [Sediminibacillus albus]|uniref:DUF1510 domain-containing protein n=1 Tax=Sediminibacillus albus TaxID=407036 RepID=A0A1G9CLF0_9BACI|nr:YrrS family protein [Sediminibacillus albus]SDK52452.1 Protein of unknown function [Sediminibacillus albus]